MKGRKSEGIRDKGTGEQENGAYRSRPPRHCEERVARRGNLEIKAATLPIDCHVALRAPRNDVVGVTCRPRSLVPPSPCHFIALLIAAIVFVFAITSLPIYAFAETDTTIAELSEATQNQPMQVTVKGEAIGDILNAQEGFRWFMLLDEGASISIFVTEEDAQKITWLGRYNQVGTILEITGVFHVECDMHDGLTDIHATTVKVLAEGYRLESSFDGYKIVSGTLLIVLGAALILLHWRLRERTR